MNANYTFPRTQVGGSKPPGFTSPSSIASLGSDTNRESNALRASVLDAALQLGIGNSNNTVANWIFNSPIEEDEEVSLVRIFLTDFFFISVLVIHTIPRCVFLL